MEHLPAILGTIPGWITSGSALALLTVVLRFVNEKRRVDAAARKIEAEAEEVEVKTNTAVMAGLAQEVGRLQERVRLADESIKALRSDIDSRISHEAKLEQENRALRAKVTRMERRIDGLETIFKLHPITPAMQAELDKLEREDLDA